MPSSLAIAVNITEVVMVLVEQMLHRREILTAAGESLQAELFRIRKVSDSRKQ